MFQSSQIINKVVGKIINPINPWGVLSIWTNLPKAGTTKTVLPMIDFSLTGSLSGVLLASLELVKYAFGNCRFIYNSVGDNLFEAVFKGNNIARLIGRIFDRKDYAAYINSRLHRAGNDDK